MKKLLDFFIYNWHYKLLALLFAVLLWFIAASKEVSEAEIDVKLNLIPTGNYKVVDFFPKKIKLTVEGYRKTILALKEKGSVDYRLPEYLRAGNGTVIVKLTKDRFVIPFSSIKVKSFFPETIKVRVEKLVEKAVPVRLDVYGLPYGSRVKIVPNYVVVLVPEGEKNRVKWVRTERVDLSGVKGTAEIYLRLVSRYKVEPSTVKLIIFTRKGSGGRNG